MHAQTIALLALADSLGIRKQLLEDLAPLVADKAFFSAEQVAKRYDVSLSCVKNWKAQGFIKPSFKLPNGTARYTLNDLKEFENDNQSNHKSN